MENLSHSEIEKIHTWLGTGSINIFGRPFSGKDTQGKRLAQFFHAPLIGGGDILRNNPDVPHHILETINQGNLAPTDEFVQIITPYFAHTEFTNKPLVLSSVGRWHGEEEAIMKATAETNHPIKAVVLLDMAEKDVRARWDTQSHHEVRGQRADDAEHILHTRLQEFQAKTVPVLDFYQKSGLLIKIDGTLRPDEVTKQILAGLLKFAQG